MDRIKTQVCLFTAFGLSMLCGNNGAQAKVYIQEYFTYPTGNLYQQGDKPHDWRIINASYTSNPIQVAESPLTYPGYHDTPEGNAAVYGSVNYRQAQGLVKRFMENDDASAVNSGTIYYSALIQVHSAPRSANSLNWFMGFVRPASDTAGNPDKAGQTVMHGALFAKDTDNGIQLGITRSTQAPNDWSESTFEKNQTMLVVVKYEFVEGDANDVVSLWVNPATDLSAEPQPTVTVKTESQPDTYDNWGVSGIGLTQCINSKSGTSVTVDAIRVADSWAELFGNAAPTPSAAISSSVPEIDFPSGLAYLSRTKTVNIKAEGITDDITIEGLSAPFSTETVTIPADKATSPDGFDLNITYYSEAAGDFSNTLTLRSGDASALISLSGSSILPVQPIKNSQVIQRSTLNDRYVVYTGKAVVTMVTDNGDFFAQDIYGGMFVQTGFMTEEFTPKVGDEYTNLVGTLATDPASGAYAVAIQGLPRLTASDKSKEPLEISAKELGSDPESYIFRLVKISDRLSFDKSGNFAANSNYSAVADDSSPVFVRPFSGTSAVGTPIPPLAHVAGVSYSMSDATVVPRSADDIVEAEADPTLEVTSETLFDGVAAPMGVKTAVARFTVEATALKKPVSVYLTGAGASQFSLSAETVEAGTSTTEITVYYTPLSIGKHQVRVNFETSPTELNTGYMLNFMSYDPANMPTVSVEPESLATFEAAPGETATQTVKITTANFPDYPAIKAAEPVSGAFTVNSTMLLKDGESQITFTFNPKAEGSFSQTFLIEGVMFDTRRITISGEASQEKPDVKQGDELKVDFFHTYTELNETFESVSHGKPFALKHWNNIAEVGMRAWWGHEFAETGNRAAKVTAYDSKVNPGEGSPCVMTLYTPVMQAAYSANKLFTFRVMGENMTDDMTDRLEMYLVTEDLHGNLIEERLDGIGLPATADENGSWMSYVIDFAQMDVDSEFAIAFRFSSTRGRDNSAVYYVDDVTFGLTSTPYLFTSCSEHEFKATVGKTATATLTVRGQAVKSDIGLSLSGTDAENFRLSTSTLPDEGGRFNIEFSSSREGIHEASIEISGEGAPKAVIYLTAINTDPTTAIDNIAGGETSSVVTTVSNGNVSVSASETIRRIGLYTLSGQLIKTIAPDSARATFATEPSCGPVAIIVVTTDRGTYRQKINQ